MCAEADRLNLPPIPPPTRLIRDGSLKDIKAAYPYMYWNGYTVKSVGLVNYIRLILLGLV